MRYFVLACLVLSGFETVVNATERVDALRRPIPIEKPRHKPARRAPAPLAREGLSAGAYIHGYWMMPDNGKSVSYTVPFKAVSE